MAKRIRSKVSAQIDQTNALPENNVAEAPSAPMESKAAGTGEVTEACVITIGPPIQPWEVNAKFTNAYASMYEAQAAKAEVKTNPQPKREGTSNGSTGTPQRYSWNGIAATAILRWMGANGIKAKAAGNALTKLGLEGVSRATVQTQVQVGRKPDAKLPTLTEEQVAELMAATA